MSPADIAAPWLAGGAVSVEHLKHGLTNESWLVRGASNAVVVRISHHDSDRIQIDRHSEAVILARVQQASIGPEVLLCDPAEHLLVTRYLGPTWTESEANLDNNIARLALLLRRLHALEVPAGVQKIDLERVISRYLSDLDANGAGDVGGSETLRRQAHEVAATLDAGSASRLCHTDVHALNIVDGGGLRLLDWEYAGIGEPLFDLASVCVFHRYSPQQRRRLLQAYAGEVDEATWRRLEIACWLFDYIRALWQAVRSLSGWDPADRGTMGDL